VIFYLKPCGLLFQLLLQILIDGIQEFLRIEVMFDVLLYFVTQIARSFVIFPLSTVSMQTPPGVGKIDQS